ncbi:tam [Drosophila busckii]|uniref:DNA polymerase subunit gamma-1 n=1 Tax=Drosophila busckii TaxID=30019 RepID=A0A0M4ERL2_DROBS|nr:tam [Drosophila busckii]
MRLLRNYATKASREHYASSSLKIYRKLPSTSQLKSKYAPKTKPAEPANSEYAENLVKVQMISKNLHRQIFPQAKRDYDEPQRDAATRYNAELLRHGIDVESGSAMPDVELKLPPLRGKNIEEHFYSIAKEQVTPYEALLQPLVDCAQLPAKPKRWLFQTGWTAYDEDGSATPVDKPMEQGIVFDVEVCVREGSAPVLATAVSTKRWYCWVSSKLTKHRTNVKPVELCDAPENERPHYTPDELIPLGTGTPGLVRFPHPASLAGMLEMGCAYLPVNGNWERYIREAQLTYEDLSIEAKYHLGRRAEEACALLQDEQYKQHLWLWDEDWSVQKLKLKQAPKRKALPTAPMPDEGQLNEEQRRLQRKFQHLYDQQALLPARRPLLPGYPQWYRKLCRKPPSNYNEELDEEEPWLPGASEISTGMQLAPKLLSLCWEGYPLHYQREHGWGFLVPFRRADQQSTLPLDQLLERCAIPEFARQFAAAEEGNAALELLPRQLEEHLGKRQFHKKISQQQQRLEQQYKGAGVWCNQVLDDCCFFLKLPHKNGPSYRVGNPLSKDFLNKFSEHALSSGDTSCHAATRVIEIARMMSYWRNNRDRILNQMVVVVAGTLTRRAMEPTWMTASNSRANRIGSELRAMVQAPPGYKLVGADVDSQELWIASVLGDAYAHGQHGATPLGWMTLSGSKSNGSDMHSSTAKVVGISRDHAKVLNYARIYGAGQQFAETLLQQFNPSLSATEAKAKAMKMFAATKGKRVYRLREEYHDELEDRSYSGYEATRLAAQRNRIVSELFHRPRWQGGTESAMFNRLEEIATREQPQTPFLNCRLSRALESAGGSEQEQRFLPTRVNWVVQSGAVDFLHLMLVSMRWLLGPHARFCLSFHDELRYLVKEELAYKAALAMHITNLLTRAFCASRLGLNDLPMSVAFFSSVEVDTVLRKECTMDCQTPSNPHGLQIGYGIPAGQTLSIQQAIEQAGGNDLTQWAWLKRQTI